MFGQFEKVQAMDFLSDLKYVPYEPDSSAGFAFGGLKGPPFETNHVRAFKQANALIMSLVRGDTTIATAIENSVPDVSFVRTQLTYIPEKLKVRNVWGEHFTYILLEGLFARPLLDFFVEHDTFFFIGKDPRSAVPELLREYSMTPDAWLYTTDWSSFDASAQRFEIELAFKLLESMLTFPNAETRMAWEFVKQLFMTRKIAASDGNIYFKTAGVPSGSYFTIMIDSIINFIRILYIFRRFSGRFPRSVKTQGDDGVSQCHKGQRLDLHAISIAIKREFEWEFNPDKVLQGRSADEVEFLSRTAFGMDNFRDAIKLERLALYPEFPVESGEISLFRVSSILDESSVRSPALEFVREQLAKQYKMPSIEEVPRFHRHFIYKVLID